MEYERSKEVKPRPAQHRAPGRLDLGLLPLGLPLALDGRAGHLWALDEANETLSVLDTGTGHLLRTVALRTYGLHPQVYPRFMVVDGVTHRGFALSVGPTGATRVAVLRI